MNECHWYEFCLKLAQDSFQPLRATRLWVMYLSSPQMKRPLCFPDLVAELIALSNRHLFQMVAEE